MPRGGTRIRISFPLPVERFQSFPKILLGDLRVAGGRLHVREAQLFLHQSEVLVRRRFGAARVTKACGCRYRLRCSAQSAEYRCSAVRSDSGRPAWRIQCRGRSGHTGSTGFPSETG